MKLRRKDPVLPIYRRMAQRFVNAVDIENRKLEEKLRKTKC